MADKIIEKKTERSTPEILLDNVPVIKGVKLDSKNISFAVNTECKKLSFTCDMITEYSDDTPPLSTRKSMVARRENFDSVFDMIFPNDDEVLWTNPQKTLINILLNLVKEKV